MTPDSIAGYSREQFVEICCGEHETDIRRCLNKGAHKVQVDHRRTASRQARSLRVSPEQLHRSQQSRAVPLLARRAPAHRDPHLPGQRFDATHSADVDYADLLPSLFELKAGNFYIALAGQRDRRHVLKTIRKYLKPDQRIFVGVIAPSDPHIETSEDVRDRVLEASEYIPIEQLGTTDDCGFSPFFDNTSTSRDAAFAKIQARVRGTALARSRLGAQQDDDE